MKDMKQNMGNFSEPAPNQTSDTYKKSPAPVAKGDYIDFEEIKN